MEMGRMLLEYCLNAVWLVPVTVGAAWLLVKVSGLRAASEYRVWLAALVVCLALPGLGVHGSQMKVTPAPVAISPTQVIARSGSENVIRPLPPSGEVEPVILLNVPPTPPTAAEAPRRQWLVRRLREVPLGARVMAWFGWVYAGVVGFAAFRMVRIWSSAFRLVREASPYAMSEAEDAVLAEVAAQFRVVAPRILQSARVQGPVVTGVWRTALLLPDGFSRCSEEEQRAALCHEMAHLQRRDCLVHAGVQAMLLPLVWHPGVHFVSRRIARTREMVCDELAVAAMNGDAGRLTYARCLLHLAQTMIGGESEPLADVGMGLFRTNKLEERVMRLTAAKRIFSVREMLVRRVGGVVVAGLAMFAGAMVHVAPVIAQQSAPAAPVAPIAPVAPMVPAPPLTTPDAAPITQEVPAAAPAPPMLAPGTAPAPAVIHAAESAGESDSTSIGKSGSDAVPASFPGAIIQNDRGVHVMVKDGNHEHRWVGADGEQYEVRDDQVAPYTKQQERAAEAEYRRKLVQVRVELDKMQVKLDSPEFKIQMDKLSSEASKEAMAKAEADLAKASAQFDSPEFKAQIARINSPEFKAQMDAQMKALRTQMAKVDSKEFQEQLRSLTSAEVESKLAEAERQAALVDTPAMQQKLDDAARRMDEAAARLEAATKALAEAQKHLQQAQAK